MSLITEPASPALKLLYIHDKNTCLVFVPVSRTFSRKNQQRETRMGRKSSHCHSALLNPGSDGGLGRRDLEGFAVAGLTQI